MERKPHNAVVAIHDLGILRAKNKALRMTSANEMAKIGGTLLFARTPNLPGNSA